MKFTAKTASMLAAVVSLEKAHDPSSAAPALGMTLLSAAQGSVTFTSSDMDAWFQSTLTDVEVENVGQVAIPTAQLLSILRAAGSGTAAICSDGMRVEIQADQSRSAIHASDPATMPRRHEVGSVKGGVIVNGELLAAALDACVACASDGNGHTATRNVCMKIGEDSTVCFVSTDGFRIALSAVGSITFVPKHEVTVPARILREILRVQPTSPVEISFDDKRVEFSWSGGRINSRLATTPFPNCRNHLPTTIVPHGSLDSSAFLQALFRARAAVEPDQDVILSKHDDQLIISSGPQGAEIFYETLRLSEPSPGALLAAEYRLAHLIRSTEALSPTPRLSIYTSEHEAGTLVMWRSDRALWGAGGIYVIRPADISWLRLIDYSSSPRSRHATLHFQVTASQGHASLAPEVSALDSSPHTVFAA